MIHDHALMIRYALVGFISRNFFKQFYIFLLSTSLFHEVYMILEIFLCDESKIAVMHCTDLGNMYRMLVIYLT
jgi:hypothetical protein